MQKKCSLRVSITHPGLPGSTCRWGESGSAGMVHGVLCSLPGRPGTFGGRVAGAWLQG